jgi:hypothetical protein
VRNQTHSTPIIQRCYSRFLVESSNSEDHEYSDAADQIREVLIHEHYMSQKDIDICVACDLAPHANHPNYPAIEAIHQHLRAAFAEPEPPPPADPDPL